MIPVPLRCVFAQGGGISTSVALHLAGGALQISWPWPSWRRQYKIAVFCPNSLLEREDSQWQPAAEAGQFFLFCADAEL
jgi:hypothetical protein